MLRRTLFILIFLMDICVIKAQTSKVWTLEECLSYAVEHSVDVHRQSLLVDRSKLDLQERRLAFVPMLSASSVQTMSTGRVLDPTTYVFEQTRFTSNNSSSVEGSITLFEGGKKQNSLNRAKQSLRYATLKEDAVRFDLKINVIAAYMDLLCAEERVEISRTSTEIISAQLVRSKTLLDAGNITESDILQLHSQLFAAENDLSSALQSERLARLALCDLLEIDEYETFNISFPLIVEENYMAPVIESVVDNHLDYQASLLNKSIAEADYKIAKSSLYPSLSLTVGYGSSWSDARKKMIQNVDGTMSYEAYPFMAQYTDNASAFMSLGLRIPIFSGLTSRNSLKRAEIAMKEAEIATDEIHKQIRKRILQAQIDCESAHEKYKRAQAEVQYAEEAYRQIDDKYNLGATDYLNWNTALVESVKANYALIESKYSYIFRCEILRMYTH